MADYLHWPGEQQRWLQERHPGGILELDDGSLWKIAVRNEPTAAGWIRFSSITVKCEFSSAGAHCYSLINTSFGQQVSASYAGNAAENPSFDVA